MKLYIFFFYLFLFCFLKYLSKADNRISFVRINTTFIALHCIKSGEREREWGRRESDRQTDTQTDRQIESERTRKAIERQRHRERQTDVHSDMKPSLLHQEGRLNCEGCQKNMRIVVMEGKTSGQARDAYIRFIKDSNIAHQFDSDDIKVLSVCVCVCVCGWVGGCVCVCVCMCLFICCLNT